MSSEDVQGGSETEDEAGGDPNGYGEKKDGAIHAYLSKAGEGRCQTDECSGSGDGQ